MFEKWVTSDPIKAKIDRYDKDSKWMGLYKNVSVQLAWQAWREGIKQHDKNIRGY